MQIRHQPDFIYFKIKLYKIEFEISLRRLSLLCRLTDIKIAWINPCDESKQQTSLNSFKKSLKNGNHKISHADYAKFILMVSAFTFSNAINAERFYCFFFFTFLSFRRHGAGHIQHSNYRNDVVISTLNF